MSDETLAKMIIEQLREFDKSDSEIEQILDKAKNLLMFGE